MSDWTAGDVERVVADLDHISNYLQKQMRVSTGNGVKTLAYWASVCREAKKLLALREPVEPHDVSKMIEYKTCGACHNVIEDGDKFCRRCGRKIKQDE